MLRIDAHHHFWFYDPKEYPWIDDRMEVLRQNYLPETFAPVFRPAGVQGVIPVQAHESWRETWQLLQFANENDFIRGVVGWLPLTDHDLQRKLPMLTDHPKLKGIRHNLQDNPDAFFMLRDDFNQALADLRPYRLAYDILIFERHLPQTIIFVDRHPEQVFVLDHIGKPRIAAKEISPWRESIRELALRPNVYCKLSGMITEADWTTWSEADLRPYFDVVLEAFGPERLMFGSDWPVCLVAGSYQRWVNIVSNVVSELPLESQEAIWSGTARRAYNLA